MVQGLSVQPGAVVVDGTVGGGGHLDALARALQGTGTLIGIDADREALVRGREKVATYGLTTHFFEGNFRFLKTYLQEARISEITHVLLDLGWSSFQLDTQKGFSLKKDDPLLMTYGNPQEARITAQDLIETLTAAELADIFFAYGEERFSRRIAERIVRVREETPITTARALADVVARAVPIWYRHRRVHPATKVFQALRIAVNDELDALRQVLGDAIEFLAPGGRIAVITFHSIEDRIVKKFFETCRRAGIGTTLTKKPIMPSSEEVSHNPRARSAKLRIFIKNT